MEKDIYDEVVRDSSKCTACGELMFARTACPRIHPVLDVLVCLVSTEYATF